MVLHGYEFAGDILGSSARTGGWFAIDFNGIMKSLKRHFEKDCYGYHCLLHCLYDFV